jgi:plasmid stability protein
MILAAARREAPAPSPSLWQRWWQACQRPRWQVAFASLVGVALMLTLVQRSPEQPPMYDIAPEATSTAPASAERQAVPISSELARPVPQPIQSAPAGALSAPAPAAPMADFAKPAQTESFKAEMREQASEPLADEAKAKVSKRAAGPVKTLDDELREVLRLRGLGQVKAADDQLAALHERFPKEDLAARIKKLQEQ